MRDQLEQEFGAGFAERHEAQFIDDQQLVADHLLLKPQQSSFIPRFHQFVNECGCGDKSNGQALLAGGQPETEGDVGFASAAWAERVMSKTCLRHDDILAPFNPFAARQFQHLHLVQGWDRLEVKAVRCPAMVCKANHERGGF